MLRSLSVARQRRSVYTASGYPARCEMRLVYLNYLANAYERDQDRKARIANRVLIVSLIALGFLF